MNDDVRLRQNLRTASLAEYERMKLQATAKQLGLNPGDFKNPFPGNKIVVHNHGEPAPVPVRKGLSKLAGLGIALAGAAFPLAGIAGYLLAGAKPAVSILQPVEKTVEKIVKQPGKSYGVDVDVELIPPPEGDL
mgnify:FL=1